jgi:hypothetical protein
MKIFLPLAAIAIIGVLLFVAFDPASVEMRENRAAYQRQQLQLDLEREQLRLEQERQRAHILEPAGVAGQLLVSGVLLVALVGLVYVAFDAYARRRRLVYPNASGAMPVPYADAVAGRLNDVAIELASMRRAVELATAQRANVPHVYSPSLSYSYEPRLSNTGTAPALDAIAAPAVNVPTFAQLLDQGRVGKGQPLLLGVDLDDGAELPGSWLDLYSTIVAGLPGAGKTTSQRFFACQTALHGAGFVVVDPHAGAAEDSLAATLDPLRAAFLCEPASDDARILEAVKLVDDIGRRRVQGDSDRRVVVLWIDETTALLNNRTIGTPLAALLEEIARQYRKVGIYASASGQIWSADRSGGSSALRDSFASVLCHRIKRNQARLLLPLDDAQRVERLEKGQAILWRTSGESNLLQIPLTTAEDAGRVARLLTADAPFIEGLQQGARNASVNETVNGPSMEDKQKHSAVGRAATLSTQEARILELARAAKPISEIVAEVYGAKGGPKYSERAGEVMRVIAQQLQGGTRDAA